MNDDNNPVQNDEQETLVEQENVMESQGDVSEKTEIEILLEEKKIWEEKFLRTSADLQNVRRRAEDDRVKARFDGMVAGIMPFLSVVDMLERAFSHVPPEMEETDLVKGMRVVEKSFKEKLASMNVEFFGEAGEEFDEKKHESLLPDSTVESGKIGNVFEKGISMNGKILRYAKVSVGV